MMHANAIACRCRVQAGGVIGLYGATTLSAVGCTFRSSQAATNGGVLYMEGGSAELRDCVVEDAAADNGGAFQLSGSSSLIVRGGRVGSCAASTGGVLALAGGTAVFESVHFDGPSAATVHGGIVHQTGGTLELTDCSLANAAAATGGAVSYTAGSARIRRTTIAACTATSGGGVSATAADLLVEDSVVRGCTTTGTGGSALALPTAASGATLLRTLIVGCSGGPAVTAAGALTVADGSSIRECDGGRLFGAGGLFVLRGGRVSIIDASIIDCHVTGSIYDAQAGGVAVSAGGTLNLHNVTIGGCTSVAGGAAVDAAPGATVRGALVTLVHNCAGLGGTPLAHGDGNGSLLLRALRL